MSKNLVLSAHAKSGYKYIRYDGRASAKKKPWSVAAPNYRSKGFATAALAAEHYSRKFHPDWWQRAEVRDTEMERMQLFGIRLRMTFKKKTFDGTVVAYLPATQEHMIRFDGQEKTFSFRLLKEKNWERIPWSGNTLDASHEVGEVSTSSYLSYGPDCPKCAAFLGIGIRAWSRCQMCGQDEPGAATWSGTR